MVDFPTSIKKNIFFITKESQFLNKFCMHNHVRLQIYPIWHKITCLKDLPEGFPTLGIL